MICKKYFRRIVYANFDPCNPHLVGGRAIRRNRQSGQAAGRIRAGGGFRLHLQNLARCPQTGEAAFCAYRFDLA